MIEDDVDAGDGVGVGALARVLALGRGVAARELDLALGPRLVLGLEG